MAPPYNALGDGNTNDLGGIQQAIYDACGATPPAAFPNITRKTVYLPRAPVCYLHNRPLRVPCPQLEIKGDTGSALCQNYSGNAMIQAGWGTANLPYVTALVGSGNSLVSAAGIRGESIDLSRFLNAGGSLNLNTRFASAFNIAFFDKITSGTGGQILSSIAAYPGPTPGAPTSGAFSFILNGSNQVVATANLLTTGVHTFAACGAQTTARCTNSKWTGTERPTACGKARRAAPRYCAIHSRRAIG
jgi:hypothetical protein